MGNMQATSNAEFPMSGDIESQSASVMQILLVEDHADTARAMRRLLEKTGYHVKTAASIAEAVKVADESKIDLLVCDIGLPDGSGLDLLRDIRRRYDVQAICLSGYGLDEDIEKSLAAGFVAHFTKPVDMSRLELLIQRLLGSKA